MTGFAGLIMPSGADVDPDTARAMADAIAYMGPDRQETWRGGRAFLAHALLATTFEEQHDRQPLSFDGAVHLVADARIDGRADLIRKLRAAGRTIADDATDSALILHAWHIWGEDCCAHLIGDFAFAIWDARAQRLFAARDQFGSVPFYYALAGGTLIFANSVPALLAHPGVDHVLNRQAIGDYLLFGYSLDRDAGFYRHIGRLPPAHSLTFSDGAVRTRRYWSLPEADFADAERTAPAELVEHFGAVLAEAVRDRVRCAKVATTLSGGMDSTLLTALAMRGSDARIDAYSFGSDWLVPNVERHWAWRCAHHIGVPFHSVSTDVCYVDPPGGPWRPPPEPRMEIKTSSFHLVGDRLAAEGTRVLLMGMGGDAIVAGGRNHWSELLRTRDHARLMREAWAYWRHHRRRPPLRGAWLHDRPAPPGPIVAPLDPDFVCEQRLEERWREGQVAYRDDPRAGMASSPFWTEMLVASHPESTRLPLRARQPFFDVRLLEAAMRLPPTPWQFDKAMLRRLGEGLLPDEIVRRPKTAFGINPAWEAARRGLEPWLAGLPEAAELDGFIDRARLARIVAGIDSLPSQHYSSAVILPAGLAAWLRNAMPSRSNAVL
ncbi:MAG TPA: asparagine synthase-related protein [Sphingopyxis sp.]|nr:asparagine synthase-related protein [Sphingopyxis sp.]HMP45667.1 asparagine synthase-related protein [Sphingopyxis sp.]HMQ17905.1 asparagine synthase-related protein [Sphingopyxis sp.]